MRETVKRVRALHHACTCQLHKADIPVVQEQIRKAQATLKAQYEENTDRTLETLLLLLLAAVEEGATAADAARIVREAQRSMTELPRRTVAALRAQGKQLMKDGANFQSLRLTQTTAVRKLAERAGDDLGFWFRRAFLDNEASVQELREHVVRFLENPEIGARKLTAQVTWLQQAREIVLKRRQSFLLAADTWGYRWFNLGVLKAHEQATLREARVLVAVNNPPNGPDQKTTPFCRWVHGRRVGVTALREQAALYFDAIDRGDAEGAQSVWPLLSGTEARGEAASFKTLFRGVGLPPYHQLCRTILQSQLAE